MRDKGINIPGSLSKDEEIAYLKGLTSTLELKVEALTKDNDALAKETVALAEDNVILSKDYSVLKEQVDYYKGEYERLVEQIKIANARYWGAKSERIMPYQVSLFNDAESSFDPTAQEPECVAAISKAKARKKKSMIDYSKFETTVIEYELAEGECQCPACSAAMTEMGVEVKHTIKLVPAHLVHEEHRRHVYVCRPCSGANAKDGETPVQIIKAKMPCMPIDGSCATPSLLSYILYQKYCLALPVYRISEDMARSTGLTLTRQTLANWVIRSYEKWLAKIYALMKRRLLERDIVFIDETEVQVLKEPDRSPSAKSYMWLFASAADDRPLYIFEYHPSRARNVVTDFLTGWSGTIMADGYSVYDNLGENITRLSCIVHIRRYYSDIIKGLDKDKLESMPGLVTATALKMLNEIISIDNGFDKMDPDERKAARLAKLKPKMDAFYQWCLVQRESAMPSMPLHKALNYSIAQWPRLSNVLADGRLPIDNNFSERSIRPYALGRKNWLFSDTPRGAHASAAIYSITTTAKGNGLKPREYLEWVLSEMPNTEGLEDEKVLERFLPWSDEIPETCRVATNGASLADPLDEPIIDIDPLMLKEE